MLGKRKHFLWRGWQCGLPVHSHPQSRGNSGLGNKWSLVSCLSAQKDGGVLRVGVIWVHLQLQLECKQFELLKENVILPWIWILHFNFSSPQTSLFFATAAHGEIPILLLFHLSPLKCLSHLCLPPFQPPQAGKNRRLLKNPPQRAHCANPLQLPITNHSPVSAQRELLHLLCRALLRVRFQQEWSVLPFFLSVVLVSFCHYYPTPFLPLPTPHTITFTCVQFPFIHLPVWNTMPHGFSGNL